MKFSIITITHNRAHLIGETIESVLKQTYQDFEHIIIDDGSTDNTEEIVNAYIKKSNGKIVYIKKNRIGFLSKLRNIGLKSANGEIISILDSDDLWENNKLEELKSIFEKQKEVNFVFHNFNYFSNNKISKPFYFKYKKSFYKDVYREAILSEILSLPIYSFKKHLINDIGYFDETFNDGQHDFFVRMASKTHFYYLNKSLSLIRHHDGNMTNIDDVNQCFDAIKTYDKLKKNNQLEDKLYKEANYLMNYNIAKFYHNNKIERKIYLKKVLSQAPMFSKVFIKSFLFKISVL